MRGLTPPGCSTETGADAGKGVLEEFIEAAVVPALAEIRSYAGHGCGITIP
jgi:hypothetical protein